MAWQEPSFLQTYRLAFSLLKSLALSFLVKVVGNSALVYPRKTASAVGILKESLPPSVNDQFLFSNLYDLFVEGGLFCKNFLSWNTHSKKEITSETYQQWEHTVFTAGWDVFSLLHFASTTVPRTQSYFLVLWRAVISNIRPYAAQTAGDVGCCSNGSSKQARSKVLVENWERVRKETLWDLSQFPEDWLPARDGHR